MNTNGSTGRPASILLLLLLLLVPERAFAQAWTGNGPNDNWSTGANWAGGVAPASSSGTVVTFLISPRMSPIVDVPWTINRMDLFSGVYTVTGQAITFAGASPLLISSAQNHVVSAPLVIPTSLEIFTNVSLLTVSGGISGTGALSVNGIGAVRIEGVNTFSGGVSVVGGTALLVVGSIPGPVTVGIAARVSGAFGTVGGDVIVQSTGYIASTSSYLALSTGNLTIAGTALVHIGGPAPGTQYGIINVTGTVNLTGGTLVLTGGHSPSPGQVFTIITNDGGEPVTSTFAGLPEGGTVLLNGVPLRISYLGGTGNDVTLTALGGAPPVSVPTLSQWSLLLLATFVLGIGSLASKRKR
ncbi:IPTL-CTERM sorting domain-containing protein [Usitatibacter palustris]|uniref:IPTL-CTERM protein sorting domain-containing protein n=1 Tax=Usitatibacter palustris TaxID=2732487 RepID=A0A6M4H1K8_9PROT|nr:IPTL-CTERM sorting domain-containing protein [Usitatibacter palustris]QJR13386.1 hypothetical protein DSM104440_00169 [Usitatibacter palustris]